MKIIISESKEAAGYNAAQFAADILRERTAHNNVRFIAATGKSQFDFLDFLCNAEGIKWQNTTMFHLDEYIGLSSTHPASLRKYLSERLINKVHPGEVHLINGNAPDPVQECKRIGELITTNKPIDIAFIGIGENGHIAFNDPPADFETNEPYIIVTLDLRCRQQQASEGWFNTIENVPKQAISMSINQLMKSEYIVCICPDKRKAEAVKNCLSFNSQITPEYPASILKKHQNAYIFLDKESASLLNK